MRVLLGTKRELPDLPAHLPLHPHPCVVISQWSWVSCGGPGTQEGHGVKAPSSWQCWTVGALGSASLYSFLKKMSHGNVSNPLKAQLPLYTTGRPRAGYLTSPGLAPTLSNRKTAMSVSQESCVQTKGPVSANYTTTMRMMIISMNSIPK